MSTYPPLFDRSALFPDRPELMDSSVGECLSAMLQEDMLMGSERPYGSRLSAAEDVAVRKQTNKRGGQICRLLKGFFFRFLFCVVFCPEFYLWREPVPPAAGAEACRERRQQPTPPRQIRREKTERSPPGKQPEQLPCMHASHLRINNYL